MLKSREKRYMYHKGISIREIKYFLPETVQDPRQWNDIIKVFKGKK